MTDSEIVQLRFAGFTEAEIKNLRKVVRSSHYLTSNNSKADNVVTLNIPEEARFFFGLRRSTSTKEDFTVSFKLNDERIIENVHASLLQTRKKNNQCREEYIEISRRLNGNDRAIYSYNTIATIRDSIIWFYAIDVMASPREGVRVK